MSNLDLTKICDIIILVGAIIVAIKNIYGFFKKPVDSISEKMTEREAERIKEIVTGEVPKVVDEYGKKYGNEFNMLIEKIDELKTMQTDQNKEMASMQKKLDLLTNSQLDMMRYDMNRIYYKYLPYHKILDCDKKAFIKLYDDYKPMGGNTWIDAIYPEILEWETVHTEAELKVDK